LDGTLISDTKYFEVYLIKKREYTYYLCCFAFSTSSMDSLYYPDLFYIYFTLKSGWKRCWHAKKHENKSEDNWPEGIKHSNEFKQRATHNVRTAFDWDYHPVYSQCQNYIYLRQLPCDSPVTKLPVSQLSFSYTCCW